MMRKGITSKNERWITKKALGRRLRCLRTARGLSQQALASALHIDRSTCAYYETGGCLPDITMLLRLCELLNTDLYTLCGFPRPSRRAGPEETPGERMMIYTLRKPERQLVAAFRMLLPEKQARAFRALARMGILTGTDRETPPDP